MYWKRDLAAAAITSLLTLPLLLAGTLGMSSPPPPTGHLPELGRSDQVATAHTIFDPAGDTNETTVPVARSTRQEPAEAKDARATEPPPNPARSTEPQAMASQAPTEASAVPDPHERARHEGRDDEQAATDESVPEKTKPEKTERAPEQPIQSMSSEQIHREVVNYRARIHEGQYQLTLDHSELSVAGLESITHFWCVTSERDHRFLVDQRGRVHACEKAPDDLLMGDLGDKWPAVLVAAARKQLGPAYQATVQFALIDSAAVLLYRELSRAIGPESPHPGTEFLLGISINNGQLKVEFKGKRNAGWRAGGYGRTSP